MTLKPTVILLLASVLTCSNMPADASQPVGFTSAREIIDSRGSDPLAGIWQLGADGATIAVLPTSPSASDFDIVILDSHDMSVIPGQSIGHARSTGKAGIYDASFVRSNILGKKTVRCIITLGKDGRLSFDYYKQGYNVKLRRLLPYLFRFSVNRQDTRPTSVDGAVRLYPPTGQGGPLML